MNIILQAGGLSVLSLLFYFYKRQGSLGLYIGRIFVRALYVAFFCLLLDILSIVLIVHQEAFPVWLVEGECKLYLVSLVATGYMALIYANADIRHLAKADKFNNCVSVIALVISLLVFILPIHIFYDGQRVVYTYGPACYATYVGALFMILLTLAKLWTQGANMNPKRRSAIQLWVIIWSVAAILQFLDSELLLVGFAGALGVVILFFELENPEIYIDRDTGFYNSYALTETIRQRYRLRQNSYGMLISLDNIQEKNIPIEKMEAAMAEIQQFVRHLPGVMVFKTDDREISLMAESAEAYEKVRDAVFERFQRGWLEDEENGLGGEPLVLRPHYLLIPSAAVVQSADEMLSLLRYFRLHCADLPDSYLLVLDEDTIARKRRHDELLGIIDQAIKADRIEVFYQPIYSTGQRKFTCAEALARIRGEDGEMISPGLFIPVAEETGLITKIGEIVFEKTCRFIKENGIAQYGLEYIEVNLSGIQCQDKSLADTYIGIMKKYDLEPRYINLEITESTAIVKKNILLENMRKLIDYGVTFSLDDFGNGQSNLNYVMDMPVDIVKFDYGMTKAYFETSKAKTVLESVAVMMHDMRLKIVAEGVETREQLAVFEGLGIDYIQGFYFSRPVEGGAFIKFVREHNCEPEKDL